MPGLVDNYGHLGGAIVGGASSASSIAPLVRLSDFRVVSQSLCLVPARWASPRPPASASGDPGRSGRVHLPVSSSRTDLIARARAAQSGTRRPDQRLHYLYADKTLRPIMGPRRLFAPARRWPWPTCSRGALGPASRRKPGPRARIKDEAPEQLAGVLDRLDHIIGKPWGEPVAADLFRLRHARPRVRHRIRRSRSTRSTNSPSAGGRPRRPSPPTSPSSTPGSSSSRSARKAGR